MADEERPPLGEVGIFSDINESTYHASPGLSQSALKVLGEEGGPAKFRYGDVQKDTKSQKLGTLVHSLLLEPHTIMQRYRVTRLEREDARSKAWQEEAAAHPGKIMVKQPIFDQAMRMVDAIFRWSSVARELLLSPDDVAIEQSFWWVDPESGLLCRGRADVAHNSFQVLLDVKSARDASTEGFRRAVREFGYNIQNAQYVDGWPLAGGWKPVAMVFIVVEPVDPYLTANYELQPDDIADGRSEIRRLIGIYQECDKNNFWPGYSDGVQTLPPIYRKRDFDV